MKYIKKVSITNFRNIHHLELNLNADTSIITGKNKLGKSNVLNAINWVLTDTLLTDKYGVGENDIESIVPTSHIRGEHTEVTITLDSGIEYSKIYKVGYTSDGSKINKHTTEYKRNGVPVNTQKAFYQELYEAFGFIPVFNTLKINEVRLMTNPLYALLIIDPKELRKLLVAMGCSVSNEELYQMGYEYMRPLEEKYQGRWDDVRANAKSNLKEKKQLLETHIAQSRLYNDLPKEYDDTLENELKTKRDKLNADKVQLLTQSVPDAAKELALKISETRVDEKAQINERNLKITNRINEIKNQLLDITRITNEKWEAETKPLRDEKAQLLTDISKIREEQFKVINEINALNLTNKSLERQCELASDNITNAGDMLAEMLVPSGEEITCPHCHKTFIKESNDAATKEEDLRNQITINQNNINAWAKEIKSNNDLLDSKTLKNTEYENHVIEKNKRIKEIDEELINHPKQVVDIQGLYSEKEQLEAELLKPLANSKLPQLEAERNELINNAEQVQKAKIQEISSQLFKIDEELGKVFTRKNEIEKKNQLLDAIAHDQSEINDAENWVGKVDDFIHTMIRLINQRAKDITGFDFVMLEENLSNGNLTEVCYATVNDVPFKDLNTADKMKYGIKFLEKSREIAMNMNGSKNYLPILADRLESISFVEDIRTASDYQLICTRVNQCEEMKVE